jgi:hypothetical protein
MAVVMLSWRKEWKAFVIFKQKLFTYLLCGAGYYLKS